MNTSVNVAGPESPVELPAFLDGFRAIHRAMRRDAARLEVVAEGIC